MGRWLGERQSGSNNYLHTNPWSVSLRCKYKYKENYCKDKLKDNKKNKNKDNENDCKDKDKGNENDCKYKDKDNNNDSKDKNKDNETDKNRDPYENIEKYKDKVDKEKLIKDPFLLKTAP